MSKATYPELKEEEEAPLADDILEGAGAISCFLFGSERKRRKVYWLAEVKALPLFRIGNTLCGRRTTLMRWIAEQEEEGRGE